MRHSLITAMMVAVAVLLLALITGWTRGAMPFQPFARFSDAVTTHYPSAQFFADSINERGEFPVWRGTIMAGQPFAANPLNKTAYPLTWLAVALPILTYFDVMIALHLLLAAAGMYCWARRQPLRWEAACLCAISYALAPRLIAHLAAGHLDLMYALAWFPWLMVSMSNATGLRSPASWIWVGVLASLVFLADVRFALYAGVFSLIILLVNVRKIPLARWLPGALVAGLVFALATAALSVPLAGWSPYLTRGSLSAQDASLFALAPANLISLFLAPRGNVETLAYFGIPLLMLATTAVILEPRRHLLLIAAITAAVIWSFGPTLGVWTLMTDLIPPLRWFRVPSRALLIALPLITLLAGYGIQALMDGPALSRRVVRRIRLAVFTMTALCVSLGLTAVFVPSLDRSTTLALAVLGLGSGVCILLGLSVRRLSRALMVSLGLLLMADQLLFAQRWLEWRHIDEWFMPHSALAQQLIDLEPERIYSPTYSVPQFVAEYDYLELFGGVDPFQIQGVSDAISAASGVQSDGYSVVQPPLNGVRGEAVETANRDALPDPDLLAAWGVSHVVSAYTIDLPALTLITGVDGQYIYANNAYSPDWGRDPITGWPAGWNGLPDSDAVGQLNQLVLIVTPLSLLSLAAALIIALLPAARRSASGAHND